MRAGIWTIAGVGVALAAGVGLTLLLLPPRPDRGNEPPPGGNPAQPVATAPQFVGRGACVGCHADQARLFEGSHHDLSMQVATPATVLGDFRDATFKKGEVLSRFSTRDGQAFVEIDGPDGAMKEYEVTHVFGVTPLQQYLVDLPGGRKQSLPLCWDSRAEEQGGQRWFHIYPDESIDHTDELHWTGPNHNWNFMCAECHSTNLKRNYDPGTNTYETTWSEIDVSCEACHGPGSRHVEWAAQGHAGSSYSAAEMGLIVSLKDTDDGYWAFSPGEPTAQRSKVRTSHAEINACARCHSRRGAISSSFQHGESIHDHYQIARLEERLYHVDGQILDEVYVYGSFVQSKMYHQGVTCKDCHDPHSLQLRAPGNAVCFQCHTSTDYDSPSHHFHQQQSEAARCVSCHMPTRTYMVVDPRLDHSIRIPRPDLTTKLGTPNACNGCHADQSAEWASQIIRDHFGAHPDRPAHYGEAIAAGRAGEPGAIDKLIQLARADEQPAIARATASGLLIQYPSDRAIAALKQLASDEDAMVRAAALEAFTNASVVDRADLASAHLDEPIRLVRLSAARLLSTVPLAQLTAAQRDRFDLAMQELIDSILVNADRANAQTDLGNLYVQLGRIEEAERAYRSAILLAPVEAMAYVNLADLLRALGRDDEGETLLRQALSVAPESGAVQHTLGLLLVRRNRLAEAIPMLRDAVVQNPQDARFAYVYAVGLDAVGQTSDAIQTLSAALAHHPYDLDLLSALAAYCARIGDRDRAILYVQRMIELRPDDSNIRQMLQQLEAGRP